MLSQIHKRNKEKLAHCEDFKPSYQELAEVSKDSFDVTDYTLALIDGVVEMLEGMKEQDECIGEDKAKCPWCSRDMDCRDRAEQIGHNQALSDATSLLLEQRRLIENEK